jgi:hypothetical protein
LTKPVDQRGLVAGSSRCADQDTPLTTVQGLPRSAPNGTRTLESRVQEQVGQLEQLGRLKRFFSPQLAELIVTGGADDPLKTHRREVTSCSRPERLHRVRGDAEPEEVMGVPPRSTTPTWAKLILEHDGTLERFTGDGMMIFFNDPVPVADPAERAIKMAFRDARPRARSRQGLEKRGYDLALGVGNRPGLRTRSAPSAIEGRWDYGAIGTVTNPRRASVGGPKVVRSLVSTPRRGTLENLINSRKWEAHAEGLLEAGANLQRAPVEDDPKPDRGRLDEDLPGTRASATRRVQPQGGAREPGARRTSCTLSARPRAPTKRMGPYRRASGTRAARARRRGVWCRAGRRR